MNVHVWKRGDVAMVRDACKYDGVESGEKVRILVRIGPDGQLVWWGPDGFLPSGSDLIESVRPVVVIDPEEIVHPDKLVGLLRERGWRTIADAIEQATKPRIEEPTGWLSVVEDNEGIQWYRWSVRPKDADKAWISVKDVGRCYPTGFDQIDVRRVLSEGCSA